MFSDNETNRSCWLGLASYLCVSVLVLQSPGRVWSCESEATECSDKTNTFSVQCIANTEEMTLSILLVRRYLPPSHQPTRSPPLTLGFSSHNSSHTSSRISSVTTSHTNSHTNSHTGSLASSDTTSYTNSRTNSQTSSHTSSGTTSHTTSLTNSHNSSHTGSHTSSETSSGTSHLDLIQSDGTSTDSIHTSHLDLNKRDVTDSDISVTDSGHANRTDLSHYSSVTQGELQLDNLSMTGKTDNFTLFTGYIESVSSHSLTTNHSPSPDSLQVEQNQDLTSLSSVHTKTESTQDLTSLSRVHTITENTQNLTSSSSVHMITERTQDLTSSSSVHMITETTQDLTSLSSVHMITETTLSSPSSAQLLTENTPDPTSLSSAYMITEDTQDLSSPSSVRLIAEHTQDLTSLSSIRMITKNMFPQTGLTWISAQPRSIETYSSSKPTSKAPKTKPTLVSSSSEPTSVAFQPKPTIVSSSYEPTSVVSQTNPTMVSLSSESTSVSTQPKLTIVSSISEPTSIVSQHKPTIVSSSSEPTSIVSQPKLTLVSSSYEPKDVLPRPKPTIVSSSYEPTSEATQPNVISSLASRPVELTLEYKTGSITPELSPTQVSSQSSGTWISNDSEVIRPGRPSSVSKYEIVWGPVTEGYLRENGSGKIVEWSEGETDKQINISDHVIPGVTYEISVRHLSSGQAGLHQLYHSEKINCTTAPLPVTDLVILHVSLHSVTLNITYKHTASLCTRMVVTSAAQNCDVRDSVVSVEKDCKEIGVKGEPFVLKGLQADCKYEISATARNEKLRYSNVTVRRQDVWTLPDIVLDLKVEDLQDSSAEVVVSFRRERRANARRYVVQVRYGSSVGDVHVLECAGVEVKQQGIYPDCGFGLVQKPVVINCSREVITARFSAVQQSFNCSVAVLAVNPAGCSNVSITALHRHVITTSDLTYQISLIVLAVGCSLLLITTIALLYCLRQKIIKVRLGRNRSRDSMFSLKPLMKRKSTRFRVDNGLSELDEEEEGSSEDLTTLRPAVLPLHELSAAVDKKHKNYSFHSEFQALEVQSRKSETLEAKTAENRAKNRYINILPFDNTRVKLLFSGFGENHYVNQTDYINASYLTDDSGTRDFIASQGPLEHTVADFWRMVYEQKVSIVVMVTNLEEGDKKKCAQYWPSDVGQYLQYSGLRVQLTEQRHVSGLYTVRSINLSSASEMEGEEDPRQVSQYHYLAWPDHGVPDDIQGFIGMTRDIIERSNTQCSQSPITVHCSAGVGRTGTYIVIHRLLRQLFAHCDVIDVFGHVLRMRRDRMSMVQTQAQYVFIHDCLSSIVSDLLQNQTSLSGHREEPVYENQEMFVGGSTTFKPNNCVLIDL